MDLVCITVTEKLPFYFKRPPINVVSVTLCSLCESLDVRYHAGKGAEETVFLEGKNQRLVINRQFKGFYCAS